jgi:hypothetical protein
MRKPGGLPLFQPSKVGIVTTKNYQIGPEQEDVMSVERGRTIPLEARWPDIGRRGISAFLFSRFGILKLSPRKGEQYAKVAPLRLRCQDLNGAAMCRIGHAIRPNRCFGPDVAGLLSD